MSDETQNLPVLSPNAVPTGSTKRVAPTGLITVTCLFIIVWGLGAARDFLIPLCIAGLLSFLIMPIIRFLVAHKVPDWVAIVFGTALLLLPFLIGGSILVIQGQGLVQDFPRISKSLAEIMEKFANSDFAHKLHLEHSLSFAGLTEKLGESASVGASLVVHGLRTVLETGSQIVLIFIFTILMVASREHLRKCSEKILAQFENIESAKMLDAVVSLVEQFLLARLVVMIAVAALTWVLLFAFGVPYSFLLSVIVGFLTVIPEVGFVVSLIPVGAVAAATGHSFLSVTVILLVSLLIHLIEANIFSPKLVGHKLNINVLASFIGLFGGGLLWGVWGMLLSVPILAVLRIVLSATPHLQPWGELLSEREDRALTRQIIKRSRLPLFFQTNRV